MKIKIEEKGYIYKKHISTGGEGEVHLIEKDEVFYIAKIFDQLDDNSIQLLNHIKEIEAPNVPKIIEIYNDDEKTVLIRDYIDGHTLYDEIIKEKKLPLERAKFITLKICETLNTFHNLTPNPIIYRDLKPENIMISNEDEIFLIDFGIARYHKEEVTRDTVLAGTKGYTAPEVMAGMQSDRRSDIYSIGLIFYEMITGKNLLEPPFQVRPVRESNKSLPKWIDNIIEKSTGVSMVSRYKDIDEFVSNLKKPKWFKIDKRIMIIAGSIVILTTGVFLGIKILGSLQLTNNSQDDIQQASNTQSEQETDSRTYNVMLDFQFDDKSDAMWFEVWDDNVGDEVLVDRINDGVLTLKEGNMVLKQTLQAGKFIHMQVIYPDLDKQGSVISIDLSEDKEMQDAEMEFFRLYTNNLSPISLGVNKKTQFSEVRQSDTVIMMQGNMRADIIIWLDEQDQSLRYFVFDFEDESNLGYLGVTLKESLQNQNWRFSTAIDTGGWNEPIKPQEIYTDVEFIKVCSGSITKYLEENIHSYSSNKDRVDNFISEPVQNMEELYYMGYSW